MWLKTEGIVIRKVKYGETSLILTAFSRDYGLFSYMLKGARQTRRQRANLLIPGTVIEYQTTHIPNRSFQQIKDYQHAFSHFHIMDDWQKQSILLFMTEVLQKILTESSAQEELYDYYKEVVIALENEKEGIANYALFFIIGIVRVLGYQLKGSYNEETPYLSPEEGGFSDQMPEENLDWTVTELQLFSQVHQRYQEGSLSEMRLNGQLRGKYIRWYLHYLRVHAPVIGPFKTLDILTLVLNN